MLTWMNLGLVLTGGGARSAYQVGALSALARLLPPGPVPFGVLAGISAGAISTVALASGAEDFQRTAGRLAETWAGLTPDRVYRTGALGLARIGTRWILDLSAGGLLGRSGINYLLDPAPLRALLEEVIPLSRLRHNLRAGILRGVAVSATSYRTGAGVTFFEGSPDIAPWSRATRQGERARLTLDHVMASAAIPFFFPPVQVGGEFFGDGGVRMDFPISPAIHMGADRVLAIGVRHRRRSDEAPGWSAPARPAQVPISEIAGVLLNAVFLDALDSDLERLERINRTLALVPRERLQGGLEVRHVPALVLQPSKDLGRLAEDEYGRFPAMLRYLLRGVGATGKVGEDLLSYLAFEPVYIRRLMELGESDTLARGEEIAAFIRGTPAAAPPGLVAG
jgi:NTE family protein